MKSRIYVAYNLHQLLRLKRVLSVDVGRSMQISESGSGITQYNENRRRLVAQSGTVVIDSGCYIFPPGDNKAALSRTHLKKQLNYT